MKFLKKAVKWGVFLSLGLVLVACGHEKAENEPKTQTKVEKSEKTAEKPKLATEKSTLRVLEYISQENQFSLFNTALGSAGLRKELAEKDDLTIFVASNAAFTKIDGQKLGKIITNREQIRPIIARQVVEGDYALEKFKNSRISPISGPKLTLSTENGYQVNGFEIRKVITAKNGTIYWVSDLFELEKAAKSVKIAPKSEKPTVITPKTTETEKKN